MKKIIMFFLSIIFIASIVIVTFFGMKASMDQFQVYMETIEITTFTTKVEEVKYLFLDFDEEEGYTSQFIEYKYTPDEASHPDKVTFTLEGNTYEEDGETKYYATISPLGELVFYKPKAVKVYISTKDGSKLTDYIVAACRPSAKS